MTSYDTGSTLNTSLDCECVFVVSVVFVQLTSTGPWWQNFSVFHIPLWIRLIIHFYDRVFHSINFITNNSSLLQWNDLSCNLSINIKSALNIHVNFRQIFFVLFERHIQAKNLVPYPFCRTVKINKMKRFFIQVSIYKHSGSIPRNACVACET